MYRLTHPRRRTALEETLENPLVTIGAAIGLQKREYFDMQYSVVYENGTIARVRVTGMVTNRLGTIDRVDRAVELRRGWPEFVGGS